MSYNIAGVDENGKILPDVLPPTVVTSDQVGQIIAIPEESEAPPLVPGQMLVRYAVPGAHYFTDFSSDIVGDSPVGWTPFGTAGDWKIVSEPEASGGKSLQDNATVVGRRGLAWDALADDETRANIEFLYRWKCTTTSHGALVVARASEDETPTVFDGDGAGVLDASTERILRYRAGAYSTVAGMALPFTVSAGNWYMTRFRLYEGNAYLRTWEDAAEESMAWDVSSPSSLEQTGFAGMLGARGGKPLVDWLAVATGGRTAVHP